MLRRSWAEVKYGEFTVMARIVLREIAELDAANSSLLVVDEDAPDKATVGNE